MRKNTVTEQQNKPNFLNRSTILSKTSVLQTIMNIVFRGFRHVSLFQLKEKPRYIRKTRGENIRITRVDMTSQLEIKVFF